MGDKLLLLRVFDAVCSESCTLRPALRDLVKTMAYLADNSTGIGFHGQATIARHLGIKERALRGMFAELDKAVAEGGSPVRIVRRARFRPDGRGRTSDEWVVELVNRHRRAACSPPSTGTTVPHEQLTDPRLTGTATSTNRHGDVGLTGTTMPAIYLRSDLRSDPRSRGATAPTPTSKKSKPKKPKKSKPKKWTFVPEDWKPTPKHIELAQKLGVNLEVEATRFREWEFKEPKTNADLAFLRWLRSAATPRSNWSQAQPRPVQRESVEIRQSEDWTR